MVAKFNVLFNVLWLLFLRTTDAWTWQFVNESNVYGSVYKMPTVVFAGNTSSEGDCLKICLKNSSCISYTWMLGNAHGSKKCERIHNCWLHDDNYWVPKAGRKCTSNSGRKYSPPPTPAPPKGAMNVLFVIFDDLRPNSAAYGLKQPQMPNTDALGLKSLVFERAYCQQAVCGPSRASILSGRRPDSTQMWNFQGSFRDTPGADKWNTWPQWFKTHGFVSYGVGKLYHPGDPSNFDQPYSWNVWGEYHGQGKCPTGGKGHGCPVDMSKYGNDTFPDWLTLQTAKQFLKDGANNFTKKGIPFFLGVGFVKPHTPQVFPASYLDVIPPLEDLEVATNNYSSIDTSPIEWGSGSEGSDWEVPMNIENQKQWRQGYYASAAFSDAMFGELLAELDHSGVAKDTIVVMTSDHGWGLGEHNHWKKFTNWEVDARVPLIIHHPKRPDTWGKRSKTLVELVDLYPTTAELAGIPVDKNLESIEGDSFAFLFKENSYSSNIVHPPFDAAYTQYPRCNKGKSPYNFTGGDEIRCAGVQKTDFKFMGYSLRADRWRFTEFAAWDGQNLKPIWNKTIPHEFMELYDHEGDTGSGTAAFENFENVNLAFKPENLAIVKQYSAQLRSFFSKGKTSFE